MKYILLYFLLVPTFAIGQTVTREPYLQMPAPTSMTIHWKTNTNAPSVVRCSTTISPTTVCGQNLTPKTDHVIRLTNLRPDTKYYYSVGTESAALVGATSATPNFSFVTPPLPGSSRSNGQPIRIFAMGDSGKLGTGYNLLANRNAFYSYNGRTVNNLMTDLWISLGDMAYEYGRDSTTYPEFQSFFFEPLKFLLRQAPVMPSLGNHEAYAVTNFMDSAYFKVFDLPANGQSGGVPSNTEAYYSYDYGHIHFVSLDSTGTVESNTQLGIMKTWLQKDLADAKVRGQKWIIATYHHFGLISKGDHHEGEYEMKVMREQIHPILEAGGVDLVLGGHSHTYQRSYMIKNYYGNAYTSPITPFRSSNEVHPHCSGAPFTKPAGLLPQSGTIYMMPGAATKKATFDPNTPQHPAICIQVDQDAASGYALIEISENSLNAKYLSKSGNAVIDNFTIVKGAGTGTSITDTGIALINPATNSVVPVVAGTSYGTLASSQINTECKEYKAANVTPTGVEAPRPSSRTYYVLMENGGLAGNVYSNSTCTSAAGSTFVIPTNVSRASFWYKQPAAGNYSLRIAKDNPVKTNSISTKLNLGVSSTTACAPQTFIATADTFVNSAATTSNALAQALLSDAGDAGGQAYLFTKFNITGLNCPKILSAKLRFYITDQTVSSHTVFQTTNAWTETIIWAAKPATGAVIRNIASCNSTDTSVTNCGANKWFEIPLTIPSAGEYSFGMMPTSYLSTDGLRLSSREGMNKPQLVITTGN